MAYKHLTKDNVKDFKNFDYKEFACKCGGKYCNGYPVAFSYDLAKNLQNIREHFGKPLVITSAIRCYTWNIKNDGASDSRHKKGWAVDFYINGVTYDELAQYVKTLPYFHYCYRVVKTQDVIHYDITPPAYEEKKGYFGTFPVLPKRGYFKKWDKGQEVKNLQMFLNWSNSTKLKVDGILGNDTIKEIKVFQKSNGLKVDGLFGKNCLKKAKEIKK